jgi:hypothetical protein
VYAQVKFSAMAKSDPEECKHAAVGPVTAGRDGFSFRSCFAVLAGISLGKLQMAQVSTALLTWHKAELICASVNR